MENFKLKALAGDQFSSVAEKAKQIANSNGVIVEFQFNDITCLVSDKTVLEWLERDYMNAHIMDWKTVGDDCKMSYDHDTEIELRTRPFCGKIPPDPQYWAGGNQWSVKCHWDCPSNTVGEYDSVVTAWNTRPAVDLPSDEEIYAWANDQSQQNICGEHERGIAVGKYLGAKWMCSKLQSPERSK